MSWIISTYLAAKSGWSRAIDAIFRAAPRRPIPQFATPEDASAYLMAHAKYTGNPLNGVADFYTHPERFQWAMETGDFSKVYVDCDSFASWAHAALQRIPGCRPVLYTLEDSSGKWGHHVVCGYDWFGAAGVIDTNGHRRLTALTQEQLCATFTAIYKSRGYIYTGANPTPFPF